MILLDAIHLLRETCKRKRLSLKTEKASTHLTAAGVFASTQNQALNALLFLYRECLRIDLGQVNALRARRTETVRDCPSLEETRRLLQRVEDIHGYPTRLIVQPLRLGPPRNAAKATLSLFTSHRS